MLLKQQTKAMNGMQCLESVVDGGVRTVEYVASTSGLPNFFPSITRTVNYVASGVSAALNAIRSASGKASANGTAYNNGSAFYYGTAFSEGSAMWQHFRNASGKSYAGGNWGLVRCNKHIIDIFKKLTLLDWMSLGNRRYRMVL